MSRLIAPFSQFFDGSGDPLENGWLRFLYSGTNNSLKDTYADEGLTVANANPLQLDGDGRCPSVFAQGAYKVVMYENNPVTGAPGAMVQTFDPVRGQYTRIGTQGQFADWDATTTYGVGDIVISSGLYYRSLQATNLNYVPAANLDWWENIDFLYTWNIYVTYALNEVVLYGGVIYVSLTAGNLGNQPDLTPASWAALGAGTTFTNWEEDGSTLRPTASGADIGDATHMVGDFYQQTGSFHYLDSAQAAYLTSDGTDLSIVNKAGVLNFLTEATPSIKWQIQSAGHLVPGTLNSYDLGSTTAELRAAYLAGSLYLGAGQEGRLYHNSTDLIISAVSGMINLSAGGSTRWSLDTSGNLYPAAANAQDIGLVTNEIRNIYLGNAGSVFLGSSQQASIAHAGVDMAIGTTTGNMVFSTGGSARWALSSTGNIEPQTTNLHDIGGVSSWLRNIFMGTVGRIYFFGATPHASIQHDSFNWEIFNNTGSIQLWINNLTGGISFQTGQPAVTKWSVLNAGAFAPGAADSYDIGTTALEVQNIYVGSAGRLYFGTSQNASIYWSGTELIIDGYTVALAGWSTDGSDNLLPDVANVQSIGSATLEIQSIYMGNAGIFYLGSSQQATINHNGTDLYITNDVGHTYITTKNGTGDIRFRTGVTPTTKWKVDNAGGHFIPETADTNDIGGVSNEVANIFLGQAGKLYFGLAQDGDINHSGVDFYITSHNGHLNLASRTAAGIVAFRTGSPAVTRWAVSSAGSLYPFVADTYNIGGSANEVKSLYLGDAGRAYFGLGQDASIYWQGTHFTIRCVTGDFYLGTDGVGAELYFRTNNIVRWLINGSTGALTPNVAGASNIGSTTLPTGNIYMGDGVFYVGLSQDGYMGWDGTRVYVGTTVAGPLQFHTAGASRWYVSGGTPFALRPNVSNSYDIGGTTTEIRNIYMGDAGALIMGSGQDAYVGFDGSVAYFGSSTLTYSVQFHIAGVCEWYISGTGHFQPFVANVSDIGSTTREIRDIFMGDAGQFWMGSGQDAAMYHDGANLYLQNLTGSTYIAMGATARWQWNTSGDYLPSTPNAYDIGGTANEVRRIYLAGSFYLGSTQLGRIYHDATDLLVENTNTTGEIHFKAGSPTAVVARIVPGSFPGLYPETNDTGYLGYFGTAWAAVWATAVACNTLTAYGAVNFSGVYNNSVTGRDMYVASDGDVGYLSSAARFKTSIDDIGDTSWIHDLKPRAFKRIDTREDEVGFIAEEVEEINAHYVFYSREGEIDGVDYRQLNVALLNEVQLLREELNQMKGNA